MQIFIFQIIEQQKTQEPERFTPDFFIDVLTNLYKNWSCVKKSCLKMDQDLVFSLRKIGIELNKGHLYLTSKTKCKQNKTPYKL